MARKKKMRLCAGVQKTFEEGFQNRLLPLLIFLILLLPSLGLFESRVYKELLDSGIINLEKFNAKKKQLLNL